jgi:hypothetical protein
MFIPDFRDTICKEMQNSAYGPGLRKWVWTYLFQTLATQYANEYRTVHENLGRLEMEICILESGNIRAGNALKTSPEGIQKVQTQGSCMSEDISRWRLAYPDSMQIYRHMTYSHLHTHDYLDPNRLYIHSLTRCMILSPEEHRINSSCTPMCVHVPLKWSDHGLRHSIMCLPGPLCHPNLPLALLFGLRQVVLWCLLK